MSTPVSEGVRRLTSGVSNFYILEDGRDLLLIDAGAAGDWGLFVRAVSALGHSLSDLKAVVLTHAHSDHTGFAERARNDVRAKVWIHEADAAVARGGRQGKNDGRYRTYLLRAESWRTLFGLMRHRGLKIVPILELSTFADRQTIDMPGRPLVVHVPGHTPGMSAVLFRGRSALFTGDCLVMKNPLTGRRGPQIMPSALNHSTQRALASLAVLEEIDASVILPGHGEPWTEGIPKAVRLARAVGRS